jgi:glycerol-3-phosphate acyltransferase PlsY
MLFLFVAISYLIGSIPTGLLLSRATGVDIRKSGSGNIGATNVTRLLGKKLGVFTLLGDVLKAVVPMLAVHWYYVAEPQDLDLAVSLCGGGAFLGHMYSVYLKFRGGKGVATALGVFLVLEPIAALISLLLFIGVVYFSGYVAVGSLVVSAMMTLWVWLLKGSPNHVFLAFFIGVLIWLKHADNIRRLFEGTETNWREWKKKKEQAP